MPGILPMKVIKVGTNAQSRIAQACDRCRSKKIRCDGIRPCCSQCANVGFECKTSDKLSRRAFPRGYTESLEERVRGLEGEVRELKDLLDEKDEKIDMLSRIHSQSAQTIQLPSPRRPSSTSVESSGRKPSQAKDEVFQVQQSPYLLDEQGSDSYFSGTSSARTFIEAFKHRVEESGRSTAHIDPGLLLGSSLRNAAEVPNTPPKSPVIWKTPPRLLSDQLVNVYFQEWAPLFPVLHRPSFLTMYERYVADNDSVTDKAELAQLNLVFGIASLSNGTRSSPDLESFEMQWRAAVDAIITENSMSTLQALILAQMFCIQSGDLTHLLTYKGLSTTLSARLGLHQSQKRFALGTLTCETRKKVFWSLYTVDSFTAVMLGLPRHIKDDDVHCEYPVDADDEYVTEGGFQPTLPGESTKLSSALALFRVARILSKILEEIFPAKTSYELSLKRLSELSSELDNWSNTLPAHLRLHFSRDKPSTATTSSRSPLLSLTYHYIRALLQRPVLCAALGSKESSYLIAMASSCKHMVQILQLLQERGLSFSFCLNRDEVLVLSGFGLLFQGLSLDSNSKMLKDNAKMVHAVIDMLSKSAAPCAADFTQVAASFVPAKSSETKRPDLTHNESDGSATFEGQELSTRKQLKAIATRFAANNSFKVKTDSMDGRGNSGSNSINLHPHSPHTQGIPSLQPPTYSPASVAMSEPARSPISTRNRPVSLEIGSRQTAPPSHARSKSRPENEKLPNLDYLSFGGEPETSQPQTRAVQSDPVKTEPAPTDWEKLLGNLDNGETNIYDACYGGRPVDALLDAPRLGMQPATSSPAAAEAAAAWNGELWALCQTDAETGYSSGNTWGDPSGSILSFTSDDCGSSGEDLANTEWASASSSTGRDSYRAMNLPPTDEGDLDFAEEWDTNLKL